MRSLISTQKTNKKRQKRRQGMSILPKSLQARKKPPPLLKCDNTNSHTLGDVKCFCACLGNLSEPRLHAESDEITAGQHCCYATLEQ